jgi:hypothetical protein
VLDGLDAHAEAELCAGRFCQPGKRLRELPATPDKLL